MKIRYIVSILAASFALNACTSSEDIALQAKVQTALPIEIVGCEFIDNVDSTARITIQSARFDLKLQAAKLGATHLVETHAYAAMLGFNDIGVALSGRAYKCPLNHQIKVDNKEQLLKQAQDKLNNDAKEQMYLQDLKRRQFENILTYP